MTCYFGCDQSKSGHLATGTKVYGHLVMPKPMCTSMVTLYSNPLIASSVNQFRFQLGCHWVFRLIEDLRKQKCNWREIFWKLWGLAHVLLCSTCLGHFPACELPFCRCHPSAPVFAQGRPAGMTHAMLEGMVVLLHQLFAACKPSLHRCPPDWFAQARLPGI